MKFKLKMLALAAAAVAAGSAHADLVGANLGNSSLALLAFDQQSGSYYVRDLGFTLNTFLPSSVTTLAGDGGVTGNKTPETGFSFTSSDAAFSTWLATTAAGDNILWTVAAGDALTAGANGVARMILASSTPLTVSNGTVRNAVTTSAGVSGLAFQNNPFTLSNTGATVITPFTGNNILQPNTLTALGSSAGLYYFAATTQTGSSGTEATQVQYGNSANFASVLLAANGDFSYVLAAVPVAAVPLPAAAWLFGSGLAGLGGLLRRRKAAAAAAA